MTDLPPRPDTFSPQIEATLVRLERMVEARRVVVRMHLSGYEREEIIALLGWSDAKVRNLLYRGLQDLRERLTRAGYRWPEES